MFGAYKERREEHGVQLYGSLGIGRDDAAGRLAQYKKNFEFFDAPVALFIAIDRQARPRPVGRPRRLHPHAGVSGARLRPRHLPAGGLGAALRHRRRFHQAAARADAVLRRGDRLRRPQAQGQRLPLAARRTARVLQVLRLRSIIHFHQYIGSASTPPGPTTRPHVSPAPISTSSLCGGWPATRSV